MNTRPRGGFLHVWVVADARAAALDGGLPGPPPGSFHEEKQLQGKQQHGVSPVTDPRVVCHMYNGNWLEGPSRGPCKWEPRCTSTRPKGIDSPEVT